MTLCAIQVVPRVAAASSGPSVSVPTLCEALRHAGVCTRLFALEPAPQACDVTDAQFFPTSRLPFAERLGVSPAMRTALARAAQEADLIHTHSLWMLPNVYPSSAVRGTRCRLMVSPRGTLSAWALRRSRWRKRLLWFAGQRRTLAAADCLHATCDAERQEIRDLGLTNPVAVIPNGVHCPDLSEPVQRGQGGRRQVLFLARIHPKKGLDRLLRVWVRLVDRYPQWFLRIAGPLDSDYARQVLRDVEQRQLPRVEFVGEQRGEDKSRCFRESDVYVLPTHSENFGISVAEALAHEVPAIVTTGAPWSGLRSQGAGWWIEQGDEPLAAALEDALRLTDAERSAMGQRGRQWMQQEFDWNGIGRRMADVYRWLAADGPRPADVHV